MSQPVQFDLDALEREGRPVPMEFTFRGQTFLTIDPLMLPWEKFEATDWRDQEAILQVLLAPEDYDRFMGLEISMHAINILAEKLGDHYFGKVSAGESDGSSTS